MSRVAATTRRRVKKTTKTITSLLDASRHDITASLPFFFFFSFVSFLFNSSLQPVLSLAQLLSQPLRARHSLVRSILERSRCADYIPRCLFASFVDSRRLASLCFFFGRYGCVSSSTFVKNETDTNVETRRMRNGHDKRYLNHPSGNFEPPGLTIERQENDKKKKEKERKKQTVKLRTCRVSFLPVLPGVIFIPCVRLITTRRRDAGNREFRAVFLEFAQQTTCFPFASGYFFLVSFPSLE